MYKGVLDQILRLKFRVSQKAEYGFNPVLVKHFGVPVFAFPLPGVGGCTREQAAIAMNELQRTLLRKCRCHAKPNSRGSL